MAGEDGYWGIKGGSYREGGEGGKVRGREGRMRAVEKGTHT